jgi:pimeloyl-ACP methyl ester carboxylesterase
MEHRMNARALIIALLATCIFSTASAEVKNVVLVHGAFADGSGWKGVATILQHSGYAVYVVQEPLTSFEADVAATRAVLDRSGPCVLVGHSWAGMIVTELGAHPAVKSLVYVEAFEPAVGETAGGLQARFPPAGGKNVVPYGSGFVYVKPEEFAADFAGGVPRSVADFMAISQVPIAAASFDAKVTVAGWLQKPSFATVGLEDREIDPELLRFMTKRAKSTTVELQGSHALFLTHPKEVAALIERAAKAGD